MFKFRGAINGNKFEKPEMKVVDFEADSINDAAETMRLECRDSGYMDWNYKMYIIRDSVTFEESMISFMNTAYYDMYYYTKSSRLASEYLYDTAYRLANNNANIAVEMVKLCKELNPHIK